MTEAHAGALAYLDANVFIDFAEGIPEYAQAANDLFLAMRPHDGVFATSELTLAEVLSSTGGATVGRDFYMELIVWNPAIALVPVSSDILIESAGVRRHTRHKLPDAIHVATAMRKNCRYVISRDKDMDKLPLGMTRRDPGPATIAALLEALRGL